MRRVISRVGAIVLALSMLAAVCAGCRFDGVNSLDLPGNAIAGDSYSVHARMQDVQNLVPNSLVRYDNVIVGVVRRIALKQGIADVELDLEADVRIPRGVHVSLTQTSVLGAQYLEIVPPAESDPKTRLLDGDVIDLRDTDEYPSTESVLAALSLVLNGSGLEQLRSIMTELNTAVGGRDEKANQAIKRLTKFVGGLDKQRDDIGRAIDALGRLSDRLAAQKDTIAEGIETITPALAVLNEQREDLVTMLDRVGDFGRRASTVIAASKDDIASSVASLKPVLGGLQKSGDDLAGGLLLGLSFPWPVTAVDKGLRGDYQNLFLTLDLSVGAIRNKVIGSIPGLETRGLSRQAADPLRVPTTHARGDRR